VHWYHITVGQYRTCLARDTQMGQSEFSEAKAREARASICMLFAVSCGEAIALVWCRGARACGNRRATDSRCRS